MSVVLPAPISWIEYYQFKVQFEQHIKNLSQVYKIANCPSENFAGVRSQIFHELSNPLFWQNLIQKNKEVAIDLQAFWVRHEATVGLSAYEILAFKDALAHQELRVARYLRKLTDRMNAHEQYNDWLPKYYEQFCQNILKKLHQQLIDIQAQQECLQQVIFERAQLHKKLAKDRRFDDVLVYVVQEINKMGVLEKPLPLPAKLQFSLDDDCRVAFYDYYKMINQSDAWKIAEPINQPGYKEPVDSNKIKHDTQKICIFYKKSWQKLGVTLSKPQQQNEQPSYIMSMAISFFSAAFKTFAVAYKIYNHYAWLVALGVTFTLYMAYAPLVINPITMLLGPQIGSGVGALLFWGAALGPLWYKAIQVARGLYSVFKNHVSLEVRDSIANGLDVLLCNQSSIATKYAVGIIDIAHIDIKAIADDAKNSLKSIDKAISDLQKGNKLALFIQPTLKAMNNNLIVKLKQQKSEIIKNLQLKAEHIVERVELSLTQVKLDENNELAPVFNFTQLKKLQNYVKEFGSDETLQKFNQCINLSKFIIKAIEGNTFIIKNNDKNRLKTPWGKFIVNQRALSGWRYIANGLMPLGEDKNNVITILDILEGNICSPDQVDRAFKQLDATVGEHVKKAISSQIFKALSEYPIFMSGFLAQEQQQLIVQWVNENSSQVVNAEKLLKQYGDAIQGKLGNGFVVDDDELIKVFQLLDIIDMEGYIRGRPLDKRSNIVREYLSSYQGDTACAVHFLRFVPETQKAGVLNSLCERRMKWLLDNYAIAQLGEVLERNDIYLFQNIRVNSNDSYRFNYRGAVESHSAWNSPEYSKAFSALLKVFKDSGLDGEKVYESYLAKYGIGENKIIQSILISSLGRKYAA